MSEPLALDLFCCAGGMSRGLANAGFTMRGVDNKPQPRYPYAFVKDDALAYVRKHGHKYHLIHASPPCQRRCAYRRRGAGVGDGYEDLIDETRNALEGTGRPYVIENVEGARAQLRDPVRYCGSSFGLDVRRHRLFESNFPIEAPPCDHSWQTPRFPPATNRTNLRSTVEVGVWRIPLETQRRAMGIDWMELRELSEAIPPAYGEHVGRQALAHIRQGLAA